MLMHGRRTIYHERSSLRSISRNDETWNAQGNTKYCRFTAFRRKRVNWQPAHKSDHDLLYSGKVTYGHQAHQRLSWTSIKRFTYPRVNTFNSEVLPQAPSPLSDEERQPGFSRCKIPEPPTKERACEPPSFRCRREACLTLVNSRRC